MTRLPLIVVVAWEADPEMEVSGPNVYLGVCFGTKHLLKGEEGSRSGQKRSSSAGLAHGGLSRPHGFLSGKAPSDDHMCQHGLVFTALHRSIVLCFHYILLPLEKLRHKAVATCPILEEMGPELNLNLISCVVWCVEQEVGASEWREICVAQSNAHHKVPPSFILSTHSLRKCVICLFSNRLWWLKMSKAPSLSSTSSHFPSSITVTDLFFYNVYSEDLWELLLF